MGGRSIPSRQCTLSVVACSLLVFLGVFEWSCVLRLPGLITPLLSPVPLCVLWLPNAVRLAVCVCVCVTAESGCQFVTTTVWLVKTCVIISSL